MFFNIFVLDDTVSCVCLCADGKIGSLIFRDEHMLNSLCEPEHNGSGDTEDALDADRSWDNPPVTLWVMDDDHIFTLKLKKLLLFIGNFKSNAKVLYLNLREWMQCQM